MKIQKFMNLSAAKKIREYLTVESAKKLAVSTGHFIMENKMFCLQLGIMAGTVLLMQDSSFANSVYSGGSTTSTTPTVGTDGKLTTGSGSIRAIEGPLNTMATAMSGPVAKGIVTIGAAVGAASWAMNIENQVTKTAMRVIGGGSVAAGASAFLTDTTGFVLF